MPSMYEIYDTDAAGYDALVSAEDHEGNLCTTLLELASWDDAVVVEAGIGTGRVTRCYVDRASRVIGCDRSAHMLARAATTMESWAARLELHRADHRSLPVTDERADLFVEGWAFGHAIVDAADQARHNQQVGDRDAAVAVAVASTAADLVEEARRVCRPGGRMILIETLGTNADAPAPPLPELAEFYRLLETRYGFEKSVIRTDYRFDSVEEAAGRCAFFFGPAMGSAIRAAGRSLIPEFTGIWAAARA
mgnify:FL=1